MTEFQTNYILKSSLRAFRSSLLTSRLLWKRLFNISSSPMKTILRQTSTQIKLFTGFRKNIFARVDARRSWFKIAQKFLAVRTFQLPCIINKHKLVHEPTSHRTTSKRHVDWFPRAIFPIKTIFKWQQSLHVVKSNRNLRFLLLLFCVYWQWKRRAGNY